MRTYPLEVRNDDVWVDLSDPPFEQRYQQCVKNLRAAFDDHSYDRIAREIARLIKIGADPLDALRLSIDWSWQRLQFGWTHAYAGMADWLALYDENPSDREAQLGCLVECVAHTADDVLRELNYPFTETYARFEQAQFLLAVEDEDEDAAVAMVRGGLREGMQFTDFESALTHAALAHYNDFGHSLIYVTKAGTLIKQLGQQITEPVLLSLVRSIIFARREDKIPEFRCYTDALSRWGTSVDSNEPAAAQWHRLGIEKALDATIRCSAADEEKIYTELLLANAVNLLSFDIEQQEKTRVSVSGNIGWLDFTHGLTFANAVRRQCTKFPELWPQGLLQMACFSGRNAAFILKSGDIDNWRTDDIEGGFRQLVSEVLDHGLPEYIVSVHWLKTVLAAREECRFLTPEDQQIIFAAVNRFIHSPLKRRHLRRTAYQSLNFVDKE